MGIFGSSRTRARFAPPADLVATPRKVELTAPFAYDYEKKQPAIVIPQDDPFRKQPAHSSLLKKYDAAGEELRKIDLMGIRLEVIVLLDGSGSMSTDYSNGTVRKLLERVLGFAMQVDKDGKIPVIVYGTKVQPAYEVNMTNYQTAATDVRPPMSYTNMADAFNAAIAMVRAKPTVTMIVNLTDGDPYAPGDRIDNKTRTSSAVLETSGLPIFVKNLAIRDVPYLAEIDNLPSRVEILKDEDGNAINLQGNPIGNESLVLYRNDAQALQAGDKIPGSSNTVHGDGIRVIDNVDSQVVDPYNDSDEVFIKKMLEEFNAWVEVAARVGILTDVPGIDADPNFYDLAA